MKEKRVPSRPLSIWAILGLLITVLLSCGLISWLGSVNPFTNRIQFDASAVRWDVAEQKLSFFAFNPEYYKHGYYSLSDHGSVRRKWKPEDDDDMKMIWNRLVQPSSEQLAALKKRYGDIAASNYTVVNENTLIVITRYRPPLQDFYSERLHVIKDGNFDSALTIDTTTLFQADMSANPHDFVVNVCVMITCLVLSVLGIRRLSYKYTGLLAYIFMLLFSAWIGIIFQGLD